MHPITGQRRNWHCSLVMRRKETPLISGRTKYVDVCRNCGWQSTEIYSKGGQLLMWRNDGRPVPPVAGELRPGV